MQELTLPRFMKEKELQQYLAVSRSTARKFGAECGAVRHIGTALRYDRELIDQALEQQAQDNAHGAGEC